MVARGASVRRWFRTGAPSPSASGGRRRAKRALHLGGARCPSRRPDASRRALDGGPASTAAERPSAQRRTNRNVILLCDGCRQRFERRIGVAQETTWSLPDARGTSRTTRPCAQGAPACRQRRTTSSNAFCSRPSTSRSLLDRVGTLSSAVAATSAPRSRESVFHALEPPSRYSPLRGAQPVQTTSPAERRDRGAQAAPAALIVAFGPSEVQSSVAEPRTREAGREPPRVGGAGPGSTTSLSSQERRFSARGAPCVL